MGGPAMVVERASSRNPRRCEPARPAGRCVLLTKGSDD
jgi:hypothetical protein